MPSNRYDFGQLLALPVEEFASLLADFGGRVAFLNRNNNLVASLPGCEPICHALERHRDFAEHEAFFLAVSPSTQRLMGAFLHRTDRGPGAGGTRSWTYSNLESFLRDGLRLSRGMTHKNATSSLWWGGGKGVIHDVSSLDPASRSRLFREYGRFISDLRGCYYAAKDVGTTSDDVAEVYKTTRFVTCIPVEYGGSGSPSKATAAGVLSGIEAVVDLLGKPGLQGLDVVIQGLGDVGSHLVEMLLKRDVRITAFDPNPKRCADVARLSENVQVSCRGDEDTLFTQCDILAPCALGGILNEQTIPHLRAAGVCGAANNQLEVPSRDGNALMRRGILYAPDFIVNRMGIVGCANESSGWLDNDPDIQRHLDKEWDGSIYQMTKKILMEAANKKTTPEAEAVKLAETMSKIAHPINGHRAFLQAEEVTQSWTDFRR